MNQTVPAARAAAGGLAYRGEIDGLRAVAELAAGAEVPPSALMRFCQIMGFSGYSEMQKLFREALRRWTERSKTRLDDIILQTFEQPIYWIVLAGGVSGSLDLLAMPGVEDLDLPLPHHLELARAADLA